MSRGSFASVCLLCAVVAAPVMASPTTGDSVVVERKFEPGKKNYVEVASDINQKIKAEGMPGGGMDIKIKNLFGVWEEAEVRRAGKTVTLTFDRVMQAMDIPMMGEMQYDSDDPTNDENAPQLSSLWEPMVGEKVTIEFATDNKVSDFHGMDEIAKKISKKAAANPFWGQMKGRFNDKTARREWADDPMRLYPNRAIKVGEDWRVNAEEDDPQLGKMQRDYVYHLDKVTTEDGRKIAHISFTGDIASKSDAGADAEKDKPAAKPEAAKKEAADDDEEGEGDEEKAAEEAPAKPAGTKVKGKVKGHALYDVERGVATRVEAESEMQIVMPNRMSPAGGEMTVESKTKSVRILRSEAERTAEEKAMAQKIEERKKAEAAEEAADAEEDEEDEEDDEEEE